MEFLPGVGALLAGLGAIVAVAATFRGQSEGRQASQLQLAWDMQEKQLDILLEERAGCWERQQQAERERDRYRRERDDCYRERRQLEVQVEILRSQGGR